MIVGSGLLGREFKKFSQFTDIIIIAAGISNSLEQSDSELEREVAMINAILKNNNKKHKVFYISTCSIYQRTVTPYIKNKLQIEDLIISDSPENKIFRLPNVIGKTNNNTMISFFFNKIASQERFDLHNLATRQFIDVTDAAHIISDFTYRNDIEDSVINVTNGHSLKVKEIVASISELLDVRPIYNVVDSGESYFIPNNIFKEKYSDSVIFQSDYFNKTILKYRSFFENLKVNLND